KAGPGRGNKNGVPKWNPVSEKPTLADAGINGPQKLPLVDLLLWFSQNPLHLSQQSHQFLVSRSLLQCLLKFCLQLQQLLLVILGQRFLAGHLCSGYPHQIEKLLEWTYNFHAKLGVRESIGLSRG